MGIVETTVFYLLLGFVTGTAMFLREREALSLWRCALAVLAWPVFAPLLLGGAARPPTPPAAPNKGDADARLQRAEQGLLAVLAELDGAAAGALKQEVPRIQKLAASLQKLSGRVQDMDRILATPEFDADRASALLSELHARGAELSDPRALSLRTRLRNIERLKSLREGTAELLERSLLKIEEMSSQVLLLRFAVDPEREVAELMRDIAASVEGLSEGLSALA
jgi:hypothetical protein